MSMTSFLRQWTGKFTSELTRGVTPAATQLGDLQVPQASMPDATTTSVCGYCSTGCNLRMHVKQGQAVNLTADQFYPVNTGMACPKGWEALTPLAAEDRALTPLWRTERGGPLQAISWETATNHFCERLKGIQAAHGKESVAYISTGQICTEEMALLGAFAKFGMGVVHGDGNTRQCMATAVAAYKQSFGFDAPPYTYADFEESDVLVFVGANPCIAHPILWQRVLQNRRNPTVVVVDPRCTETAMAASWHVPLAPKSDLVLLYGLANILIAQDWLDHAFLEQHTEGFAEFKEFVREFTLEKTCEDTALAREDVMKLAALIKIGKRVSFWWTMGVNQGHEATRTAQALINLALMGGHMGKPGTGANSITGQCNAMGSRLFSNTTNLLGGHDFTQLAHRQKVATALGMPVECIPDRASWAYDQIVDGIETGQIKALWIIATNPAHSWIHQGRLTELLGKLDMLVVQDMYASTETAQLADLILPAAGWGEKQGTFINSERRIGVVKPAGRPRGDSLPDFEIFRRLADAWGCGEQFQEWSSPEAVFQILKRVSAGQPCDITGITDYAMLEDCGGIQWPYASGLAKPETERRLFAEGKFFTASGLAKFLFSAPQPTTEPPDAEFPMILLTGRGSSAQWHTQTRTGKSAILRKLYPAELQVEIHPQDAAGYGIQAHDLVRVGTRRGELTARAKITSTVQIGHIFLPMHHPDVNKLTHGSFDPHSRQPSYKACAARLTT